MNRDDVIDEGNENVPNEEAAPVVRWIDNLDYTQNRFQGPKHRLGDNQKNLINILLKDFKKKNTRDSFDGNAVIKVAFYFSNSVPELTFFRAAGLLEIIKTFDNYNMNAAAGEEKEIAEILGASPFIKRGTKDATTAAILDVLDEVRTNTFKIDALPQGTPFDDLMPIMRIQCSDILYRLNKDAVKFYALNCVKVASYAALIKEIVGPLTAIYHYPDREDEFSEEFQTLPIYAVQSRWAGTTNQAVAEQFGMLCMRLDFEDEICRDMKTVAAKPGFDKALETHIIGLARILKGDVISIPATVVTTMAAAKAAASRFIEINSMDNLMGFCGLLLTHKDFQAKGSFAIMIGSNYEEMYERAINLLSILYKNYSYIDEVQIVVRITSMEQFLPTMVNKFPILLAPESCLMPVDREAAWEAAFHCAVSTESPEGVDYVMLNAEEVWIVRDNAGTHVGYHISAANEKIGPNSVYNLDGTPTNLPGTHLGRLTKRLTLDDFQFFDGDSCVKIGSKSQKELLTVKSGVPKTYSRGVIKPM